MPLLITPDQVRAARILLGWSRDRLAAMSEITAPFVLNYETKGRVMKLLFRERSFDGLAAIRAALEAAGIEFTTGGDPGVKLRKGEEAPHAE